ncbi:MAG: hypothetical protein IJL26_04985 [Clostridia bacterium]|nr:hypothetical protein [Clostridia bacterium]
MTEIEKIEYAKGFIDKLAQGVNPLDDEPVPEGELLNNVRISRCMFFVSDILRQVIENGGTEKSRKKRTSKPFSLSPEQAARFRFSQKPVSLSEIARGVSALPCDEDMQKLSYYDIIDWLVCQGLIDESVGADGKPLRRPSADGEAAGIRVERRQTPYGDRDYVVYDASAQKLILDNIDAVAAMKYGEDE